MSRSWKRSVFFIHRNIPFINTSEGPLVGFRSLLRLPHLLTVQIITWFTVCIFFTWKAKQKKKLPLSDTYNHSKCHTFAFKRLNAVCEISGSWKYSKQPSIYRKVPAKRLTAERFTDHYESIQVFLFAPKKKRLETFKTAESHSIAETDVFS